MGGTTAADSPSGVKRGRIPRRVLVAALAAALVVAGVSYYLYSQRAPGGPTNTPPHSVSISVGPSNGNVDTIFAFTATVSDDQDSPSSIQVRWDWENDGLWDTAWSTNKSANHVFAQPGTYAVRVEARDAGDLTANATRNVVVLPRPLRVGTVLSTTGALSVFGISEQNAVDMAVAEINAAGGVLGQPIQVFHVDDQGVSTVAMQGAQDLVTTDRVVAVIGATAPHTSVAVLSVTQPNNVFEISPSSTSPIFSNLSYTGGWFARTVPSDALQAAVAAYYAHNNLSVGHAGVVAIDNAYGSLSAIAFAENFTRFGGTVTAGSPRPIGLFAADYTPDLHAVLDVIPAPELVYVLAYPTQGILLMENWWQGLGSNPEWANVKWLLSDALYDQANFIDPLVAAGVDVTRFQGTSPAAYAGFHPPRYDVWAARFESRYGGPPALFAANAYDATYLVALTAQAAGTATGAGIRAELRSVANPSGTLVGPNEWAKALVELAAGREINYDGASGPVNTNAFGDIASPYIIWGVNVSNQLYTKEYFDESSVVGLLPFGSFPVAVQDGRVANAVLSATDLTPSPGSRPRTFL